MSQGVGAHEEELVGSGESQEVPCVPLCGLTATCMSSERQLACRAVWVHPLTEGAAVPTTTGQVQNQHPHIASSYASHP